MNSLSVVIPTYNERKRLPRTLEDVVSFLDREFKGRSEIIISDSGSKDGTLDYIHSLKSNVPIKVVAMPTREGKGAGVKLGMLKASRDFVVFMDADNSTKILQIKKLLPYTKDFEVVIGSRYAGEKIQIKQSFFRRFASRAGNLVIQKMTDLKVKDTQCGFKLFSHKACTEIFSSLVTKGWGFDVEVLMRAQELGYKIKEVPIYWSDSKGSTVGGLGDFVKTLREVFEISRKVKSIEQKNIQNPRDQK